MIKDQKRNYKLSIQKEDGSVLIITPPFTLDFTISRSISSSVNTASISIYNLSKKNRNHCRKDEYDYGFSKKIKLEIGYGNNLSVVYQGTIQHGFSVRQGVNFVTTMESGDGYFQAVNSIYNNQFPAGTNQNEIIKDVVGQLKKDGLKVGAISDFEGEIPRGNTYSGNTLDVLKNLTGDSFFVDNETVNVLKDDQALDVPVFYINSRSGLIGTPRIDKTYVKFDLILEPRILSGQRIVLQTDSIDDDLNTDYKVMGLVHKGIISDATSGACITSLTCQPGTFVSVFYSGIF